MSSNTSILGVAVRVPSLAQEGRPAWLHRATILALLTIAYNLVEGIVSTVMGAHDETIALFGFGVDSFVEVASGLGIWVMIRRMRRNEEGQSEFERSALRVTGWAFYVLAVGLAVGAVWNLLAGHKPETTLAGIIVALVSVVTMWLLVREKLRAGHALGSQAIISDANCTRTCLYLSLILLASSLGYELSAIGGLDSLGAAGIAYYAWKEGREAFQKAKGISCCGDCH